MFSHTRECSFFRTAKTAKIKIFNQASSSAAFLTLNLCSRQKIGNNDDPTTTGHSIFSQAHQLRNFPLEAGFIIPPTLTAKLNMLLCSAHDRVMVLPASLPPRCPSRLTPQDIQTALNSIHQDTPPSLSG